MNDEWVIVYYLLWDPSFVDVAFDLGLTVDMFRQRETRLLFIIIVDEYYTSWSRPTAAQLKQIDGDRTAKFFIHNSPTATLTESIGRLKASYTKQLLIERLTNGNTQTVGRRTTPGR